MTKDISPLIEQFQLQKEALSALPKLRSIIELHIDDVLGGFYENIQGDPSLSRFFSGTDRMQVAKSLQKRHWLSLLDGTFSEGYVASTKRVGVKHFEIQLPFATYLSGYVDVLAKLQSRVIRSQGIMFSSGQRAELADMISLLSRLFFLDMTLVIEAYFDAQSSELETVFEHLNTGVQKVSEKDLTFSIPTGDDSGYPERFDSVRANYNRAIEELSQAMMTVRSSADEVDTLVHELAAATESLSGRTENQAAALEQTSAALTEISEKVRESAQKAADAEAAIMRASDHAESGGKVVHKAVEAMSKIEASSGEIANIISVIDEIAFQTNLLALNAGVEAARAGESGRGFAVVASEVRSLAMRSSDAAKHIRDLISDSNTHVQTGVGLVRATGETLQAIVQFVDEAASVSTAITKLSSEQSSTVQEITSAVGQIDEMTQQNAAMAEESAASGKMLQQEATTLHGLLGGFDLPGGRTPTRHDRGRTGDVSSELKQGHSESRRDAVLQLRQLQQSQTAPAAGSGWEEF